MQSLQFGWLSQNIGMLLHGALTTILLTVAACAAGSLIGIAVGLCRQRGNLVLRTVGATYVEAIRNTPLLVQAFIVYFGLSSVGFRLDPLSAALLALVVNCGAYSAEIFRAGFQSIQPAQHQAAESLALSKFQAFVYVILPQALRNIWVPLSGQFVLIMLASSIVSQISAEELTAFANQIQSSTFRSFEVYIVLAVMYLALSILLKTLLSRMAYVLFPEQRVLRRSQRRARRGVR
ncbi:amino acid ABC transporter permease [Azospirillum brasilense]|uniref:Amino acid ABC transporter permease n=1 Tax=Azospirillum brasilense TaxID=192 RepID=A0A6L3AS70_AZOBR|nr:amino acid ABC transporter permease [Azospirillum brasilense]KAA0677589.1 amino acid ABC transporter permease [Azospirillum brasilense]